MDSAVSLAALAVAILPLAAIADATTAANRVRSGDVDAAGAVRCAMARWQEMAACRAAVARSGDAAAVVVTFPAGVTRTLTFADGAFLRGNPTMSGIGTDTDWRLTGGTYHIRVDGQRFALPAALVFGD